jgi:hypothetical protein
MQTADTDLHCIEAVQPKVIQEMRSCSQLRLIDFLEVFEDRENALSNFATIKESLRRMFACWEKLI